MRIGVYTGTFDPVTHGHLDIITRASHLFDHLYICVLHNPEKVPLFSVEERIELLREEASQLDNVTVDTYSGLAVEYAKSKKANAMVRGLRAVSDFDFEFKLAAMNRYLEPDVDTVFMMTSSEYSFISSSAVKEVAELGGDVSKWVSPRVAEALGKKFKDRER
ncbi:MAG TPA: pantetheine-phosphate adenylyltransferase [Firmicutes bacterium]|nr:pantetheine-phosphate adenylyltransferase [Bacillota bacterium]HHT41998.1 pantetheine-phosphate adenylyltransferase [Bacillota bacterium]